MKKIDWRSKRRKVSAALWLSGVIGAVQAAPDASLSEEEFLGEMPVVLSVSRLSQPVEDAPSAVTVIDREMIRASGFRDLADIFRLVPGFYVGHATGNEQVVTGSLSGRYFGRLQVLVDGMSMYNPMWGQVPWAALPLAIEDIERIEVTRGPNAASYGANSFLGVINIITRHPSQDAGAMVGGRLGGNATADGVARYAGSAQGWDFRLTFSHKQDHGFEARNDDQRLDFVSARGDYRLNVHDSLQVQAGLSDGTFGQGYFGAPLSPPHDQALRSEYQQLRWQRTYKPDDELWVQFYHTLNSSREAVLSWPYVESGVPIYASRLDNNQDSERFELEFQRNQSLFQTVRVAWGASARLDRIRSPLYLNTSDDRLSRLQRIFANMEWRPRPDWVVNAGAMWEHNDITGTDLSPRAAVSYHITPHHAVRVGMSSALRTPTVLEDYANYNLVLNSALGVLTVPRFKGPGNLAPERITSREIAYLGAWPAQGLTLDVRAYEDDVSNIINPMKVPGLITPVNVPQDYFSFANSVDASVRGIQTQLRWKFGGTRVSVAHTYSKTLVTRAMNPADAEHVLQSNPSHMVGALLMQDLGAGVELSIGYYAYGTMVPVGGEDLLPAYRRWDARLAKKMSMGAKQAEVALIVQNLFNPYYELARDNTDPYRRNLFDTRAFVQFSLGF